VLVSKRGGNLIVRVPIIPGINDSAEEITSIGRVVSDLKPTPPIELLPYHRLGVSKYRALGREYRLETKRRPSEADLQNLRATLMGMGLEVLQ
jgi:pyruvate formate lyase activating enzyme